MKLAAPQRRPPDFWGLRYRKASVSRVLCNALKSLAAHSNLGRCIRQRKLRQTMGVAGETPQARNPRGLFIRELAQNCSLIGLWIISSFWMRNKGLGFDISRDPAISAHALFAFRPHRYTSLCALRRSRHDETLSGINCSRRALPLVKFASFANFASHGKR